ncbi:unnamed protein product [Closterium sp. NIES-65]|nr:unnamed protein product [Closterium sp. NIES-65]
MSKRELHQKLFEEFDYKEKAGSAWSHNYLNQKPWHPMSFASSTLAPFPLPPCFPSLPVFRASHSLPFLSLFLDSRLQFQKEQEYFKQTALLSKQQKAKAEAMQSVSFLYMKPPGYNAESARAAELAEEERAKQEREGKMQLEGGGGGEGGGGEGGEGEGGGGEVAGMGADGALVVAEAGTEPPDTDGGKEQKKKKKPRATDVFGRAVPTGDDFEVLKNAPRLDTGIIGRPRPFGLELRNVKCGRCGGIGHSSGERECPLFDSVTENDLKRQQREDPLSHILALNRPQPFGWQLKEQGAGGMSPVRGGFKPNDANQQILPPSDDENEGVFDQYGGFLLGGEADVAALAAGGVGGIGGGGVLMPGLGSSVLDSLTKQQRKELSRALRMKEKEERRKRRKKKERRGGGEGKSKSGREKRRKKEKKKGRGGRRSRHHRRKSDSDSSSDTGSDSSESESDSESSSGDEQTASSSDSSRSESSGSDSSCSDRSKRKRRRGSKRKRSHERKGREKEKQRRREEGGPGPREEKKEETSKSRVESRVEIKIERREIQTGATADAGERHSSRIEDEDGEEKGERGSRRRLEGKEVKGRAGGNGGESGGTRWDDQGGEGRGARMSRRGTEGKEVKGRADGIAEGGGTRWEDEVGEERGGREGMDGYRERMLERMGKDGKERSRKEGRGEKKREEGWSRKEEKWGVEGKREHRGERREGRGWRVEEGDKGREGDRDSGRGRRGREEHERRRERVDVREGRDRS